jgi:hypothetical protein
MELICSKHVKQLNSLSFSHPLYLVSKIFPFNIIFTIYMHLNTIQLCCTCK